MTYDSIQIIHRASLATRGEFSSKEPGQSKSSEDIVKGTSQWKGIRVTVKLTIQNRQAKADKPFVANITTGWTVDHTYRL